jgi:hypothetical protein
MSFSCQGLGGLRGYCLVLGNYIISRQTSRLGGGSGALQVVYQQELSSLAGVAVCGVEVAAVGRRTGRA